MTYIFKYSRGLFWKTQTVVGHQYHEAQDKMLLFYADGGIREIRNWKNCEVRLGADWCLALKNSMENQTGTSIPVAGV